MSRRRYAIAGTGVRSEMYIRALVHTFSDTTELVGVCDPNQTRMAYWNERYADRLVEPLPQYSPSGFERMVQEQSVDEVIVCTIDRFHHEYICRAMQAGCDVITEKPMTIALEPCRKILETQRQTGRQLRVTFNYRYAPRNAKVKELLQEGIIGDIISVHFEWLLNTKHGADYFRRWHRDKLNSGGLMVHKSTHHFDLVNWWLRTEPVEVFAMGGLRFYGRHNAEKRGDPVYHRGTGDPGAAGDPFALDLSQDERLRKLYLDAEHEDGYVRDRGVFSDGISIEDDVGVLVRYRSGAVMSYHLTAYSPWEGYRVMFNGSKGRLELEVVESPYISGSDSDHNAARNVTGGTDFEIEEPTTLLFRPLWGKIQQIDIPELNTGGHGGGDERLLEDLFTKTPPDPLGRAASFRDGANSILTGLAANQSMETGKCVCVGDLSEFLDAGAMPASNDSCGRQQLVDGKETTAHVSGQCGKMHNRS